MQIGHMSGKLSLNFDEISLLSLLFLPLVKDKRKENKRKKRWQKCEKTWDDAK